MVFGWFQKEEPFDKIKLKTSLKMAVIRLQMQRNKKENAIKVQQREIAGLLAGEKVESARIKVEGLIRDEYLVEAFELVTLFCELLSTRAQLVIEARGCPADMKEAVSTLIWVAPRIENVPELLQIREQLARKFGMDFALAASDNSELAVNPKVLYRLSLQVPEPYLCVDHLRDIAKQFGVEWEANPDDLVLPIAGLGAGIGQLPEGPIPRPFQPAASSSGSGSSHGHQHVDPNTWPLPPPSSGPPSSRPGPATPSPPSSNSNSSSYAFLSGAPQPTHNPNWYPPPAPPNPFPDVSKQAHPDPRAAASPTFDPAYKAAPPPTSPFAYDPFVGPGWQASSSSRGGTAPPGPTPPLPPAQFQGQASSSGSSGWSPPGPTPPPAQFQTHAAPAFSFDPVQKPQYFEHSPPPLPSSGPLGLPLPPNLPPGPSNGPGAFHQPPAGQEGVPPPPEDPPVDFADLEARFAALKRSGPS